MRAHRVGVAATVIALGLAVEWAFYDATLGPGLTVVDFLVGCLLVMAGAIASDRRNESRVGLLMTLSGFAWFLGAVGGDAVYLHRGPLVQLVLSYPSGRVNGRVAKTVVACAYIDALVQPLAHNDRLTLLLAGAVAFSACRSLLASSGPARRAGTAALVAALVLSAALAFAAAGRLAALGHRDAVLLAYDIAVAFITLVLLVDLLRARWAERSVRGLVVDLGATVEAAGLQAKLARALGDNSLVLGYRLAGKEGFVDDAGRDVALPAAGSGKTATMLEERGEQIGVLVHDEALLADSSVTRSLTAATRLALANVRLQEEARAQAVELESSRRRIVETIDLQHQRLERELRDGPGRLLARARATLGEAAAFAGDEHEAFRALTAAVREAESELRQFTHGIRPVALSQSGLAPALAELASRSPLPVEVRGSMPRLPGSIELALYFVASESLANAVKHARASRVTFDLRDEYGHASVLVSDDGVGGADLRGGTGLRGLADRVEALGGRLEITSPPGSGTQVFAEFVRKPASAVK